MNAEGWCRYHRIYRKCQHFVAFTMSFLCCEAPLPIKADQTPLGIERVFNGDKWDFSRLEEVRDFFKRSVLEKFKVNKLDLCEW